MRPLLGWLLLLVAPPPGGNADDGGAEGPPGFYPNRPLKGREIFDVIRNGPQGWPSHGYPSIPAPLAGWVPADIRKGTLAALLWLARHQSPDGSWSVRDHTRQCKEACSPHPGDGDFEAGVTGLSLLAFLGAGCTHLSRDIYDGICFGDVVRKGLRWIMSRQDTEGCIGPRNVYRYMVNHILCATALFEARGMTGSNLFGDQANRALDFIVAAQNPGQGWRYGARCGDSDSLVTGWAMLALKSAEHSGLTVPRRAYDGARAWYDEVTEEATGRVGYQSKGDGRSSLPFQAGFEPHEASTAIGAVGRMLLDRNKCDPRTWHGCDLLLKDVPKWEGSRIDFYYWHFATQALFHFDGPAGCRWKEWDKALRGTLLKNQNPAGSGCRAGSWEPVDRWSAEGGRVYATAINALTLEVYGRIFVFGPR